MASRYRKNDYQIFIVCPLPLERTAMECMLDSHHDPQPSDRGDNNTYSFGSIGEHNIVIASLGAGDYGTVSAAGVVNDMLRSFPDIKLGLMVGIAGGVARPDEQIRLGDVVVGLANGVPSILNYRLGKETSQGFDIRSELGEPPQVIQRAVSALKSQHQRMGPTYLIHLRDMFRNNPRLDRPEVLEDYYNQPATPDPLFSRSRIHSVARRKDRLSSDYNVSRSSRSLRAPPDGLHDARFVKFHENDFVEYPVAHYGTIASADTLMKDEETRDRVYEEVKAQRKAEILCFEMEAAGVVKGWPCLVIRGICDYADSHKNDEWQNFAAATAAAYAKDLLLRMPAETMLREPRADELIDEGRIHSSPRPYNINSGTGAQNNFTQTGGSNNKQFVATNMNFGGSMK